MQCGHDAGRLGEVWMLTMPSYMGYEGINPLTVHYCYEKRRDDGTHDDDDDDGGGSRLAWVVLEVRVCDFLMSLQTPEGEACSSCRFTIRSARSMCMFSRLAWARTRIVQRGTSLILPSLRC